MTQQDTCLNVNPSEMKMLYKNPNTDVHGSAFLFNPNPGNNSEVLQWADDYQIPVPLYCDYFSQ